MLHFSEQQANIYAHEADPLSISLPFFYFPISLFLALSPLHSLSALSINSAHSASPSVSSTFLPLSLSLSLSHLLPKLPISTPLSTSPFLGLCMGGPIISVPPPPPSPQSWGYWPTWHALMIIPITVRHSLPAWPRCLLIILLWSAQPEAWSTLSLS